MPRAQVCGGSVEATSSALKERAMDWILEKHPVVFYTVVIPSACVLMGFFGYGWALLMAGAL